MTKLERERDHNESTDNLKYDNIPLLANQLFFSLGTVQGAVQADSVRGIQLTNVPKISTHISIFVILPAV